MHLHAEQLEVGLIVEPAGAVCIQHANTPPQFRYNLFCDNS